MGELPYLLIEIYSHSILAEPLIHNGRIFVAEHDFFVIPTQIYRSNSNL